MDLKVNFSIFPISNDGMGKVATFMPTEGANMGEKRVYVIKLSFWLVLSSEANDASRNCTNSFPVITCFYYIAY